MNADEPKPKRLASAASKPDSSTYNFLVFEASLQYISGFCNFGSIHGISSPSSTAREREAERVSRIPPSGNKGRLEFLLLPGCYACIYIYIYIYIYIHTYIVYVCSVDLAVALIAGSNISEVKAQGRMEDLCL